MNEQESTMSTESWYSRPVFFVRDCKRSLTFYASLGFSEDWKSEDDGELVAVQVSRSDVEIILNLNPERAGGGRVFLALHKAVGDAFVEELRTAGVEVSERYWGMPVMKVSDPDGNDIVISADG